MHRHGSSAGISGGNGSCERGLEKRYALCVTRAKRPLGSRIRLTRALLP
jgi:hypothetical protein